jgi:serine protease AprX
MIIKRGKYAWLSLLALLLALAVLLPATAVAEEGEEQNVHPAVDLFADLFPGQDVPVIVSSDDASLPLWVIGHGGTVISEFDIIGGFQAEMPIAAIRTLDFTDGANWISLDAPMMVSGRGNDEVDASRLATVYPFAAGAVSVWDEGITGDDVTVAVIDSGINSRSDFRGRIAGSRNFSEVKSSRDENGHGTWVAGIIAGSDPSGQYVGIAPGADLLSVKVAGKDGSARAGDVIQALQWVVENKDRYDVRVINISLNSVIADSYLRDPLSAAVEQAWFQGIVVVVSAGNLGTGQLAIDRSPANDPYVITVGAFDDNGTADRSDDHVTTWSSRGVTVDGYAKPEVMAPGVDIVSTFGGPQTYLAQEGSESIVDRDYIRLSGTSGSAAIVSGSVALMLDEDPSLTPDEVKFRVTVTGASMSGSDAPGIDAFGATFTTLVGTANGGALPNEFIDPETGMIMEDSILWRSILWRSILWRSILWRSILWSR